MIENNVWLGERVTITKGVHIGENAVIGTGAVVTKDIPANISWKHLCPGFPTTLYTIYKVLRLAIVAVYQLIELHIFLSIPQG